MMLNYTTVPTITTDQLDFWFNNSRNVLIYGDHGVGKTSIIKSYWDKIGIKYKIFSGSTLDPWTDLVGIPSKTVEDGVTYIDYALPRSMDEDLEAIFIDEINRAPAKVRNALLELLLTKSINGRRFPKLKAIWAAANPRDSENDYDVEELDPAQEDRFHVIIKLSDEPNLSYFSEKYSKSVAEKAIGWHKNLPPEIRRHVSSRRLDYAMDYVLNLGGNARDIFPYVSVNVTQFTKAIKGDERMKKLLAILDSGKEADIKKFFSNHSNTQGCIRDILKSYPLSKQFVEYAEMEEIMALAEAEPKLAMLMAETRRPDKNKAIESFRAVNNSDPVWHLNGHQQSDAARRAASLFIEEFNVFPKVGDVELKVPNFSELLSSKEAFEILEKFKTPRGLFVAPLSEDSAVNILDFATRVFADRQYLLDMQKPEQEKFYSILFSAFNYYYERDGNLLGMSFDVPKSIENVRPLPRLVKPELPTHAPVGAPTQRKPMKNSSGVSVVEELL